MASLSALAASSARAGVPPQVCKDYFEPSGDNAFADSYLRDHPGAGMDVCRTMAGPGDIYYAIEAPRKNFAGICGFAVVPVYPKRNGMNITWSTVRGPTDREAIYPRRVYATLRDQECPKQYYAWYVGFDPNLPDAEFRNLFRFLTILRSSRSSFDAKTNSLEDSGSETAKNLGNAIFGSKPPDSVRFSRDGSEYAIALIFYDAAYALHLREDRGVFTIVSADSGVTWAGPDF